MLDNNSSPRQVFAAGDACPLDAYSPLFLFYLALAALIILTAAVPAAGHVLAESAYVGGEALSSAASLPPAPRPAMPASNASILEKQVSFAWHADRNTIAYVLQVKELASEDIYMETEPANVTEVVLAGFPGDGTVFRWRVRGRTAVGWGPWSDYRIFINGPEPVPGYGDLNADGQVNVHDVVLAMQIVLGLEEKTPFLEWAADVNNDEAIDINDVVLIARVALGLAEDFSSR